MKNKILFNVIVRYMSSFILTSCLYFTSNASSHREAPLIANDPLADNVDVYAFRSPEDPSMITIIATYVPMQLPYGGPNYYSFGENVRYEIHVDNDASIPGDEVTYRFTFNKVNEDPSTFFNIRLGKQNLKTTYTLERSLDGGNTFETILENGIVPPPNIGSRSINGGAGLNTTYEALFQSAIMNSTTGETVFAGPTDDPFFVDLGGIFDLGDAPRQNGKPIDGLACFNVSAIAIQIPITTLLNANAPEEPTSILDGNYVIGVWASASRQAIKTLTSGYTSSTEGEWVQVSRLGMPLTNEAVIPIGMKDYWNSITPYDELGDTLLDQFFFNPELALYMDDDLFGTAVPAFAPLRIQKQSLGAFDFTNGADGLYGLKGSDAVTGTALDDAVFGTLLLPGPGMPRSVDLWPAFHTGVPNVVPYQLATGKEGNPLAAGKPFVHNFLPNGGDMLRLNMAVPPTARTDQNFSSLGLIQAAAIGLTVSPFNTTAELEVIPNMDGFPNGRRLEDDVTRIELQAVSGVVLAAIGLWYDDFTSESSSPVTEQLLNVLTYSTGVDANDKSFSSVFPYLALPSSGTDNCFRDLYNEDSIPTMGADTIARIFGSSNNSGMIGIFDILDDQSIASKTFPSLAMDADGIYYDELGDVLYQLNRTDNVINAYADITRSLREGMTPTLSATSTSDFTNGREIAVAGSKLVVVQDANEANGMENRLIIYNISPTEIILDKSFSVDFNLWGIYANVNTLYAIQDNSDKVAVFNEFFNNTSTSIQPDQIITIEGMSRTHGITYVNDGDVMVLTDVADAASDVDGAFTIIRDFTAKAADHLISLDEQSITEGSMTKLGNPVDIAYDPLNELVLVAERANTGGQFLVFDATTNGNVTPVNSQVFMGASAVFLVGSVSNENPTTYVVESSGKSFELSVFPNPTLNELNLVFKGEPYLFSGTTMEIQSVDGKLINVYSDVQYRDKISVSELKAGTYVIHFANDRYQHTIKLNKI